jgi:protein-tyrosine phosphatase
VADRLVPLDGPANFRDIGGYETGHGRMVRTGRLFRADSLSYMSDADVAHVTEVLGLHTVIDLRASYEVERFTHGPLADLHVRVAHVPIVDETRRPETADAEEAAAAETMAIDAIYLLMLQRFGHRFAAVLDLISQPDSQPAVFHCAAGKDRTGLVAMLILGLLGVDRDIIAADYALTDERMPLLMERHLARANGDVALAEVGRQRWAIDAAAMRTVVDHLVAEHGSIEGYVLAQGLEPAAIERLRTSLLD